jgi:hypothetical protein
VDGNRGDRFVDRGGVALCRGRTAANAARTAAASGGAGAPALSGAERRQLTEKQIKMYIEVRRLAATLAKPDATVTDPLAQIQRLVGSLNSETTAASQLGADIEEYRWVSLQISASGVRPASDTLPLGDELTKALLAASGKAREAIGVPPTDAAAADASAAAAAYNRELLNKFKPELDALAPR